MTRLEGEMNNCGRKCVMRMIIIIIIIISFLQVNSCKSQCTSHFTQGFGCQVESLPSLCRAVCVSCCCCCCCYYYCRLGESVIQGVLRETIT